MSRLKASQESLPKVLTPYEPIPPLPPGTPSLSENAVNLMLQWRTPAELERIQTFSKEELVNFMTYQAYCMYHHLKVHSGFKHYYKQVTKGHRPENSNFTCPINCQYCFKFQEYGKAWGLCSNCKCVGYCSKQCQIVDWKEGPPNGSLLPHKVVCRIMKQCMDRSAEVEEVDSQFAFLLPGKDGIYDEEYFLASRKLLGGVGYGYWSRDPFRSGYHNQLRLGATGSPVYPIYFFFEVMRQQNRSQEEQEREKYMYGWTHLRNQPLTEHEGWHNLAAGEIPTYDFIRDPERMPKPRGKFHSIKSWAQWYEWRGIPTSSPVALIMHRPLTVYHILANILNQYSVVFECRRPEYLIHLLGVEEELNSIQTFCELTLVMPGCDIIIDLFGPAVVNLYQAAPENGVAKSKVLLKYTAPRYLGGSSITVRMNVARPLWNNQSIVIERRIDVVIALHPGIRNSWSDWMPVFNACSKLKIPFFTTDYDELSCVITQDFLKAVILDKERCTCTDKLCLVEMNPDLIQRLRVNDIRVEYPIRLNPFHKPGRRPSPFSNAPNLVNGFILQT
ncbi:hypothetical protein ABW19_dt0210141 [Dactylella cylindrospora]|nr:hypothetical protein ABW19_dt0210141 [Dactylella cylindrospora]